MDQIALDGQLVRQCDPSFTPRGLTNEPCRSRKDVRLRKLVEEMISGDDETLLHRQVDIYQVSKPASQPRDTERSSLRFVFAERGPTRRCAYMDESSHWDLPEILGGP